MVRYPRTLAGRTRVHFFSFQIVDTALSTAFFGYNCYLFPKKDNHNYRKNIKRTSDPNYDVMQALLVKNIVNTLL